MGYGDRFSFAGRIGVLIVELVFKSITPHCHGEQLWAEPSEEAFDACNRETWEPELREGTDWGTLQEKSVW